VNNPTARPLENLTVWLTRPVAQNQKLQHVLESMGGTVLTLPMLVIRPVEPGPADRAHILDLDTYDLVFFVSTNAARIGLEYIESFWPQYPVGITNFAVGSGTAAVIESHGLDVCYPTERMSSEAMLALPQLQDVAGKKALVVRGVGGREILAAGLQERGCIVDYAELYERSPAVYQRDLLQQYLEANYPDAVILSSAEAMENFAAQLQQTGSTWRSLPLMVASDRLQGHARELGFDNIRVMAGAGDEAIIAALQQLTGELSGNG
jgi:uroporphyrinogen-III synthase